jgi:GGDEF domain-containing protein
MIVDILNFFENSESFDINSLIQLKEFGLYIIELEKIDEPIVEKVTKLFTSIDQPLIYFLIGKEYNFALLKLAVKLRAKSIITSNQDVKSIALEMKEDYKYAKDELLKYKIASTAIETLGFLFFKDKELSYASELFLKELQLKTIEEVKEQILSELPLDELLDKNISLVIESKREPSNTYKIKTVGTLDKNETIMYISLDKKELIKTNQIDFIYNRFSFTEILKEKINQKQTSKKELCFLTLEIENIIKLRENINEVELYELIKDFLFQVATVLNNKVIMSEYCQNFYVVLFEDIEFEDFKTKIDKFYQELTTKISEQKYTPLFGMHIVDVGTHDLNFTLTILQKLVLKNLLESDINAIKIEYITNIQDNMDEKDIIHNLLEAVFTSQSDMKLLNFYKGLALNTPAKIVKIKNNDLYVRFESLQGLVMREEGETMLQSSRFSKDIRAVVKHISMEKKIVILTNFQLLPTSAISRKYSRVTTSSKTLVVLSYKGATLNGEVLDVSVTSIAIEVNYAKIFDLIENQTVKLTFILPTNANTDGFLRMKMDAKVVYQSCQEKTCKVVCEFIKDESLESILMEYVYNRQKEIISELKMISKNYSM